MLCIIFNITFIVEKFTVSIHFLGMDVKVNNDGTFETCVRRKPTHTGLFLNFNAACPIKWKFGLILCMLHRAKSICSSINLFRYFRAPGQKWSKSQKKWVVRKWQQEGP